MAKKTKMSSKAGAEVANCSYSPSLYIAFDDLKEVKGVSVGDKVSVVVKGTVQCVEQSESNGKTNSSIRLDDFEAEIVSGTELEKFFADEANDKDES